MAIGMERSGMGIYVSALNTGSASVDWDDSYFADSNWDIKFWGIGFAPVLGINIGLGNTISLSFDFGYRINHYWGTSSTGLSFSRESESWHSSITEKEIFFNFSVIFRIRDVF
jgi:hypothetical protein